jgi:hypothetical protein
LFRALQRGRAVCLRIPSWLPRGATRMPSNRLLGRSKRASVRLIFVVWIAIPRLDPSRCAVLRLCEVIG